MEKDSFESLLRNKVLQAESTMNQNSDKESVWNAIQKKKQPPRKWYYTAAAVLFIIASVSVFYFKDYKVTITVAKAKVKQKPTANGLAKPQNLQQNTIAKQVDVPRKVAITQQMPSAKAVENTQPADNINAPKEVLSVVSLPKANETIAGIATSSNTEINENKTTSTTNPSTVPEFAIQFKRGKPTDEVEKQTKEAIARLKKFKFSKDTTVFANTIDKQKSFFKIKF